MTHKPDAGDIVDQQAVPILPDDTAFDVYNKVTVAAEVVLWRTLPGLVAGSAQRRAQDETAASCFGRRTPEDGRIDWTADAATVHNLVRGVAPPYPGAYTFLQGRKLRILKTRREPARATPTPQPAMFWNDGACFIHCGAGGVLRVVAADLDGDAIAARDIAGALGVRGTVHLPTHHAESCQT
jgi:methionyl-tRNA formyltransferase